MGGPVINLRVVGNPFYTPYLSRILQFLNFKLDWVHDV